MDASLVPVADEVARPWPRAASGCGRPSPTGAGAGRPAGTGEDDDAVLRAVAALELRARQRPRPRRRHGRRARPGAAAPPRTPRFAARHRGDGLAGDGDAFGTGAAILLGDLVPGLVRRAAAAAAGIAAGARCSRARRCLRHDAHRGDRRASTSTCCAQAGGLTAVAQGALTRRPLQERQVHRRAAAAARRGASPAPGPRLFEAYTAIRAPAGRGVPAARRRPGRVRRPGRHGQVRPTTTCARASRRCSSRSPRNGPTTPGGRCSTPAARATPTPARRS